MSLSSVHFACSRPHTRGLLYGIFAGWHGAYTGPASSQQAHHDPHDTTHADQPPHHDLGPGVDFTRRQLAHHFPRRTRSRGPPLRLHLHAHSACTVARRTSRCTKRIDRSATRTRRARARARHRTKKCSSRTLRFRSNECMAHVHHPRCHRATLEAENHIEPATCWRHLVKACARNDSARVHDLSAK